MLLLVISCTKKEEKPVFLPVPTSQPSKFEKGNTLKTKNFAQITASERAIIKDNFNVKVRDVWENKVKDFFNSKEAAFYPQYLQIKRQNIAEASELFKAGKLNKMSANQVHLKYQVVLKKLIGEEVYAEYIKMLKEENIANRQKGIQFLIRY